MEKIPIAFSFKQKLLFFSTYLMYNARNFFSSNFPFITMSVYPSP